MTAKVKKSDLEKALELVELLDKEELIDLKLRIDDRIVELDIAEAEYDSSYDSSY